MARPVVVNVIWDAETKVWIAKSDGVPGFAIGGDALEELVEKLKVAIPELLTENGISFGVERLLFKIEAERSEYGMLLPDGRKLHASRQSHSSRLERQLFSAFGMGETVTAHALRTSGATASSASPASASSSPITVCSWLPSRRIDTARFSASFLPTTSSTGTLARECSRTL
jgi:hypothetical protein